MVLDDVSEEAFDLLVEWLYSKTIKTTGTDLLTLAQLWELGRRILAPKLQNAAIRALRERLGFGSLEELPATTLEYINDTLSNTPIYDMLVSYLSYGIRYTHLVQMTPIIPDGLIKGVMIALRVKVNELLEMGN